MSVVPIDHSNICDPANDPPQFGTAEAAAWHARYVSTRPHMPKEHNENTYYRARACFAGIRRYVVQQAAAAAKRAAAAAKV